MSIAIATMGMFRPAGTGSGTTIVEKIVEVREGGGYSGLGIDAKRKPSISVTMVTERKKEKKIEVYEISEE
jgi:hypothetical protein